MKKLLLPLLLLSGCATLTLLNKYQEIILVPAGAGDLPAGSHEIFCETYLTEDDQTVNLAQGAPLEATYFSGQCSVRIEGKHYQCFERNYSVDPVTLRDMKGGCVAYIAAWTRPKESSDSGGGSSSSNF